MGISVVARFAASALAVKVRYDDIDLSSHQLRSEVRQQIELPVRRSNLKLKVLPVDVA
jgi:hypothetical protein